jgi:phosphate transport system substrate-binding protein
LADSRPGLALPGRGEVVKALPCLTDFVVPGRDSETTVCITSYIRRLLWACALSFCAVAVSASPALASTTPVAGCGSETFAPLIAKWEAGFDAAQSNYSLSYTTLNSGAGIYYASQGACSFGASDLTLQGFGLTPEDDDSDFGSGVLQLPWALSATDIVYHLPHVGEGLKLTAPVIDEIFSGEIRNWDNSQIQDLNRFRRTKKVREKKRTVYVKYWVNSPQLPDLTITKVYRSDYSSDNYNIEDFLSVATPLWWNATVPQNPTPTGVWPWTSNAVGEFGAASMFKEVSGVAGTIGYLPNEMVFDSKSDVDTAQLRNAAGNYTYPALGNISDAAASGMTIPAQGDAFQYPITWPAAAYKSAYPLAAYLYGILPENAAASCSGQTCAYEPAGLTALVQWALSSAGQAEGTELGFAPLPSSVVAYDTAALAALSPAPSP